MSKELERGGPFIVGEQCSESTVAFNASPSFTLHTGAQEYVEVEPKRWLFIEGDLIPVKELASKLGVSEQELIIGHSNESKFTVTNKTESSITVMPSPDHAADSDLGVVIGPLGYYLGDPPYHLLMEHAPKEKSFSEIEPTAKPGFRQRKGDKPIQRGPVKRRRW